jgi:tRNA dimethylallyltransferase
VRARLESELERVGPGAMHVRLRERDPDAAAAIGAANGRRLVRALEVIELTGEPFGAGLPDERSTWMPTVTLALGLDRADLVPRLDARVERMWHDGLVDEVARLEPAGLGTTASRAIGYAQALAQLHGELDERAAIEQTAALTRRYARRQVSWFRRDAEAVRLGADDPRRVDLAVDAVAARLA